MNSGGEAQGKAGFFAADDIDRGLQFTAVGRFAGDP